MLCVQLSVIAYVLNLLRFPFRALGRHPPPRASARPQTMPELQARAASAGPQAALTLECEEIAVTKEIVVNSPRLQRPTVLSHSYLILFIKLFLSSKPRSGTSTIGAHSLLTPGELQQYCC